MSRWRGEEGRGGIFEGGELSWWRERRREEDEEDGCVVGEQSGDGVCAPSVHLVHRRQQVSATEAVHTPSSLLLSLPSPLHICSHFHNACNHIPSLSVAYPVYMVMYEWMYVCVWMDRVECGERV